MRRLLALALPLVAAVGVLPAGAAPVETSRLAEVRIALPAEGGTTLDIMLTAVRGGGGDRLYVSAVTCGRTCDSPRHFSGKLPTGALELDAQEASGRLRTSLGGFLLQVIWIPELGAGVARGHVDGGGQPAVGSYRGDAAVARVAIAERSCQGRATVGTEIEAGLAPATSWVEPLSELGLPATGAPSCTG